MNELKRKMKMMEEKQEAKEIIKQFDSVIVKLDNGIAQCREKAKEALLKRNDMNSFKMFGRSMKYYTNMKNSIETIKCQFENYLIQVEVANTFVGLKGVLGKTAKMMDSMPSLRQNSRDFMKFKKSIMKGQLSMDSINSMMANIDPSADSEMSVDEINALKDEIMMSSGASQVQVGNTDTNKGTSTESQGDFFQELDI
ncbi:MAG: hypothetical protein K6F32_04160 [Bacilli bacterium]|nr:hypothetical protein [Bacilli bacterium]